MSSESLRFGYIILPLPCGEQKHRVKEMMLEPPDQQFFTAACGYVQLQMFQEANEELEKIDPFLRAAPEVLALRIEIYRGLQKWELMSELTRRLTEFDPDNPQWPVSLAYAR